MANALQATTSANVDACSASYEFQRALPVLLTLMNDMKDQCTRLHT